MHTIRRTLTAQAAVLIALAIFTTRDGRRKPQNTLSYTASREVLMELSPMA